MKFTAKRFDELTSCEIYEILAARCKIFTVEQKIICLDPDGVDYDALHCFIGEGKSISAYLRAYMCDEESKTVKIGRVLSITHGIGLGTSLMKSALPEIKKHFGCKKIIVHAQKHAAGFYRSVGFVSTSDDFLEEGIVHVMMEYREKL